MTNAASASNPSCIVNVGSHIIGPNIVTVKLSGKNKYNLWRLQMECLLKSQHMIGFINGESPSPVGNGKEKLGDIDAWIASDSLVKGWILGSLSEEAARKAVIHLKHKLKITDFTAKDLWDELQRSYGPSAATKNEVAHSRPLVEVKDLLDKKFASFRDALYEDILLGRTRKVIRQLETNSLNPWDKITNNGNSILHVAVGSSNKNYELLKELLEMTEKENLVHIRNSDGSTLIHLAAIGGNIKAVNMLVERNPQFLLAWDKERHTPFALSVSNMHTKTSHCLFEHMKVRGDLGIFSGEGGEELVVLAISCQDFRLAREIILRYPNVILSDSDAVLTTLAQNFPSELNFWERGWMEELVRIIAPHISTLYRLRNYADSSCGRQPLKIFIIIFLVFSMVATLFYGFLKLFVRPFLKNTIQIHEDATNLLSDVCSKILTKDNARTHHQYFTTSTFEATSRNASTFIRCIVKHFPDAIWSTNEDGHNFIQYSVISRSEKIYNLLYEMSEHKNIYKTIKDALGNNLLHLAARFAPVNKLNLISGAALQLQRELQWFKEVEKFVCPLNRVQKNSDDETPKMVFTREHKDLVIEGEKWIKKTAESYAITTTLIITIVFAAAITVPGGNNQESGVPIFTNNIAFRVFAISDAISLFTAVTSLLIFLSILTARFAEQDFLFKLPTKLIIGLTMLFLSTTAMIIAFGATLFLVFGQSNLWMLIPIGALTCLPITSFVTLQFPLIVELISATYCGGIFVRENDAYFY